MNRAFAITNCVVVDLTLTFDAEGGRASLNRASDVLNGTHKPPVVQVFGDVASDMGVRHSERLMFGTVNRLEMAGFVETFNVYERHPRVIVMVRVRPMSRGMACSCMPFKFFHVAGYKMVSRLVCLLAMMIIHACMIDVCVFLADSRFGG